MGGAELLEKKFLGAMRAFVKEQITKELNALTKKRSRGEFERVDSPDKGGPSRKKGTATVRESPSPLMGAVDTTPRNKGGRPKARVYPTVGERMELVCSQERDENAGAIIRKRMSGKFEITVSSTISFPKENPLFEVEGFIPTDFGFPENFPFLTVSIESNSLQYDVLSEFDSIRTERNEKGDLPEPFWGGILSVLDGDFRNPKDVGTLAKLLKTTSNFKGMVLMKNGARSQSGHWLTSEDNWADAVRKKISSVTKEGTLELWGQGVGDYIKTAEVLVDSWPFPSMNISPVSGGSARFGIIVSTRKYNRKPVTVIWSLCLDSLINTSPNNYKLADITKTLRSTMPAPSESEDSPAATQIIGKNKGKDSRHNNSESSGSSGSDDEGSEEDSSNKNKSDDEEQEGSEEDASNKNKSEKATDAATLMEAFKKMTPEKQRALLEGNF